MPASRRRRLTRALLASGCALVVLAGATAWYLYDDLASSIASSKALEGAEKSKYGDVNILLMGLDSRRDQNGEDLPRRSSTSCTRARAPTSAATTPTP